ncbi:MAG: DNA repair protein RecN [Deltaproteobacteria bacterium]|nr:DNA repair protein RecN [Deltaproteobacteria bacterium]
MGTLSSEPPEPPPSRARSCAFRSPTLLELTVENLAIVDKLELSFGSGLNVLSGETGAGKSILVDALALLLGGRAASELVRSGAEQGAVSAVIDLGDSESARQRFVERGFDLDGSEVLIRRVIGRTGRGRVSINGQVATVAILGEVTRGLVDICGQHEHVTLVDADTHLDLLDAFGGLASQAAHVAAAFDRHACVERELSTLEVSEAEKLRRVDFLRFSVEEIRSAGPEPGELESLAISRTRLANAQKLVSGARRAEALLCADDGSVEDVLGRVQAELAELARLDVELAPLSRSAASLSAEVSDLARDLGRYARTLSADPERLGELDDRLELLKRLARKHGGSVDAVLESAERMEAELAEFQNEDARRRALTVDLDHARRALDTLALELSAGRKQAADQLARAVEAELASLSMAATRLSVSLTAEPRPTRRGFERAELLLSANPGEAPRPLSRTASGGELSRLLLAFKRVLADRDSVATYVFDEVDSGIGGRVAEILGRKLHEVAIGRQVLCITHLPQVAAYADHHFRVEKRVEGGRTRTVVETLGDRESISELARMLGGVDITKKTQDLAVEMHARAAALKAIPTEARGSDLSSGNRDRSSLG